MRHTRIRCTAAMCSVVFLALLFFTLSTSTASAAINDHIVSGKTPQGTGGCGQNLGLPWAPKGAEKICFHKKKSIRP